ncbi:MAG: hypothetical protein V4485_02340 [Pseudomonadota bacterium]
MGIPKEMLLTGRVLIKYIDEITTPKLGDVMLYLNDDALSADPGNYYDTTSSGYIKALVYDGLVWQNMDISEFCTDKENKFPKKQHAIDYAYSCKAIMEQCASIELFRTYRGHFTRHKYEQGEYIRKANRGR